MVCRSTIYIMLCTREHHRKNPYPLHPLNKSQQYLDYTAIFVLEFFLCVFITKIVTKYVFNKNSELLCFLSIGHSCRLLTKNMGLIVINEGSLDVSMSCHVWPSLSLVCEADLVCSLYIFSLASYMKNLRLSIIILASSTWHDLQERCMV